MRMSKMAFLIRSARRMLFGVTHPSTEWYAATVMPLSIIPTHTRKLSSIGGSDEPTRTSPPSLLRPPSKESADTPPSKKIPTVSVRPLSAPATGAQGGENRRERPPRAAGAVEDASSSESQEKKTTAGAQKEKELRVTSNIGENDLNMRLKRSGEFLDKGYRVKATVIARQGFPVVHAELDKMRANICAHLADKGAVHGTPRVSGRLLSFFLVPKRK